MLYKEKRMQKNSHMKKRYGITIENYDEIVKNQKDKCAICYKNIKGESIHIDHCHITKKVRGVLCAGCNIKLGWFEKRQYAIRRYLPFNPHYEITTSFEAQISKYTGAPYVTVLDSCTNALFLALMWHKKQNTHVKEVIIPKYTYISVPMQIKHADFKPIFEDINWAGLYQLKPFNIWDSARRFTSNMYIKDQIICVSMHWTKPLGVSRLGAILCDNEEMDIWFKKMIFDGRTPRYPVSLDTINEVGYHFLTTADKSAEGLIRLSYLPKHNPDLPNDDYPDLSQLELFK